MRCPRPDLPPFHKADTEDELATMLAYAGKDQSDASAADSWAHGLLLEGKVTPADDG